MVDGLEFSCEAFGLALAEGEFLLVLLDFGLQFVL